jgi:predicted Zn-ribbon and HTH transcriptional regulator
MAKSALAAKVGVKPFRLGNDPRYRFVVHEDNFEDAWERLRERLALALVHGVSIGITACCDTAEQAERWEARLAAEFGVRASRVGTKCGYVWEASHLEAQTRARCPYCLGEKVLNGLRCPSCKGTGIASTLPKARTPGTTITINTDKK